MSHVIEWELLPLDGRVAHAALEGVVLAAAEGGL